MAALTERARRTLISPWLIVVGLAAYLLSQFASAVSIPFINDDYVFLDKTRSASFLSLWEFRELTFHWYRPWSREVHFWTLQHLYGARETPFHITSWALWLGVMVVLWSLIRRLAGARAAAVTTAGVATLAAWGVPLTWISGAQELWMLLFTLLTLHLWVQGRRWLACVMLAFALLSKETAAVLAPLLVVYSWRVEGRSPLATLRHAWAPLLITAFWALVHPVLGGQLRHPLTAPLEHGHDSKSWITLVRAALVAFNLDLPLGPERGWGPALAVGAIGALILGGIALAGCVAASRDDRPRGRLAEFGVWWALLGWAPLLMPSLGWHAYYALLGAIGAWLALGITLARSTPVAVALVVALALLRPARADTPTLDWGSEWYQRRAAEFIRVMRLHMYEMNPRPLPNTRFFFVRVPSNVGFLAGDGPALRVWYQDSTLRAGFYSSYRPRPAGAPEGPDLFFRFDTGRWVEVVPGAEDVARARAANPRWERDHITLASALASGGDWGLAAREYEKLATTFPHHPGYAHDAAVSFETVGDSVSAARWFRRAASLPGADYEARRAAERHGHHLRPPR